MSKFRFTDKNFCDHPYLADCDCVNDCNGHPNALKANALLDAHLETLDVWHDGETDHGDDGHCIDCTLEAFLFDLSPIGEGEK